MSAVKITGSCTACDAKCFDIMQVFEPHEKHPGEPKQIGQPFPDAMRVTFLLYDGTQMALTFCENCADVPRETYPELWRKVIRSWQRELAGKEPDWFLKQVRNGLLRSAVKEHWKAVNG